MQATADEQRRIGPYRLLTLLGEGGMGQVFLAAASSKEGDRTVVVKVLRRDYSQDAEIRSMFLHEARLGAALSHPQIARLFDFGEADGTLYLAMEHIDGPSVSDIQRTVGVIPIANVLHIIADVASALGYAHEAEDALGNPLKIVHRDVSPQNILVSREGEVKLIDFGVAKSSGQDHRTATGVLKGKLAYMAPGQLRGEVDNRTDIFALGVVLHELLTGKRLFKRETHAEIVTAILLETIPPLSIGDEERALLQPIVDRALAKDADKRYPTALELERDLREAMATLDARSDATELAGLVAQATFLRDSKSGEEPSVSGITATATDADQDTEQVEADAKRRAREAPTKSLPKVRIEHTHSTAQLDAADLVPEDEWVTEPIGVSKRKGPVEAPTSTSRRINVSFPVFRSSYSEPRRYTLLTLIVLVVALMVFAIFATQRAPAPPRTDRASPTQITVRPPAPSAPPAGDEADAPRAPAATTGDAPEATTGAAADVGEREPEGSPSRQGDEGADGAESASPATAGSVDPESSPAERPGFLTINSSPWSTVRIVGGRVLGPTPIHGRPLPPGTYTLMLARNGGESSRHVRVRIVSGRVTQRFVDLRAP